MRSLPLWIVLTSCGAAYGADPVVENMVPLRVEAWKLLAAVTAAVPGTGLPLFRTWRQGPEVFGDRSKHKPRPLFVSTPRELAESPPPDRYLLYESTYFNPDADAHIQKIRRKESPVYLQENSRREVTEFPPTAVIAKAFWRKVSATGQNSIGIWDWASPYIANYDGREETWRPQCISLTKKDGCLLVSESFYVLQVTEQNIGLFKCNVGCLKDVPAAGLTPGDALVLVALHIVTKSRPDWTWTTFWWKGGVDRTDSPAGGLADGSDWTCDNAQRPAQIASAMPWQNYSMDVVRSFKKTKPVPTASCGVLPAMPNAAQLSATFSPFVEARLANGRSSSCIDCHSRARQPARGHSSGYIPVDVGATDHDYPGLKDFEESLRTDYNWSLAFYFKSLATQVSSPH